MNHGAILTLLHRLRVISDADRTLAVNYSGFIGDQLAVLWSDHFVRYHSYEKSPIHPLELAGFWNAANDSVIIDTLAVFSESGADDLVKRASSLWLEWARDFKEHLFVANIPQTNEAMKAIDEFVVMLAGVRDWATVVVMLSDDEKQYFMSMTPFSNKPR